MNSNEFAHIQKQIGFDVDQINGSWYLKRWPVAYSFPLLVEAPVNKRLINVLKWKEPITVIKTSHSIKNTYEYILDTDDYSLSTFRKKTRTSIKKSLINCDFKRPELNELITEGLAINREALKFQNRKDKFLCNRRHWEKHISLLYNNKDVKILGAYTGGKMIAYAVAYGIDDRYFFYLKHFTRKFATLYPMCGLIFTMINQIIAEHGRIVISDGIESFTPMPSLNKFKCYMRFERIAVTRVYLLHPLLVILMNPVVFYLLCIRKKAVFHNGFLRKVINLYHGNRIINRIIKEESLKNNPK